MKTNEHNTENLEENIQPDTENVDINTDTENQKVDTTQEELQKEKDKFMRLFAEFENYKRRTAKERLELFATASESVMTALLPVVDDFERALTQIKEDEESQHIEGFRLIANKFKDTLTAKGLAEVKIEKGDSFDADISEAITQIPAGDDMKGKVVDIVEKGYQLGEKIIRYPKVVIGQ